MRCINPRDEKKQTLEPHLRGEHGDVMELSPTPLLDRHGQEESVAVSGEDRLLVLQGEIIPSVARCKILLTPSCSGLGVNAGHKSDFPTVSDF